MRVKTLTVAGFRGFPRSATFDLDADAVIVAGVNGTGKTSMFDAILWAMAGSIGRLGTEEAQLVSRYSTSGEARVELVLERPDGSTLTIVRRFDGASHLSVAVGDDAPIAGSAAESALFEALWPDAKSATEPWEALSRSLTRATYLQQDEVREFVEAQEEQQRFDVVSELVGVGRVGELQRQLESSRNSWSRATNTLSSELDPLRRQRAAIAERLQRLGEVEESTGDELLFEDWVRAAQTLLPSEEVQALGKRSAQALDRALAALQGEEHREERRTTTLERLLRHLRSVVPAAPELEPLEASVHAAELVVQQASEAVSSAQQAAAAVRRQQVEQRDRAEAFRALAELALDHLGARCPVCDQAYDADATRARLQELAGAQRDDLNDAGAHMEPVQRAAAQLEAAENDLAGARASFREAQQRADARGAWEQTLRQHARDLELEVDQVTEDSVTDRLAASQSKVSSLRELRSEGERLALRLARAAEVAQRADLERQLSATDSELEARESDLRARTETGEVVSEVIAALRDAAGSIVAAELTRIEPLLQRVYATVDPHPSFRAVRFLTRTFRGRGRLWTSLDDRSGGVTADEPAVVLSSSQLNVLAVSTFLSLNLAIDTLPLQLVALDDPLQSLDNVNLLGLADLLRRVTAVRQVIVSTHDDRLASLLSRKLRPTRPGQRSRLVELDAWTRDGPQIEQSDIEGDRVPLRIVASA